MSGPWTDELVERLITLNREGYSCSEIAARLGHGFSRNAIIGKIHRLKLNGTTPVVNASKPPLSEEREAVFRLHSDGLSFPQIAMRTGMKLSNVYKYAQSLGLRANRTQQANDQKIKDSIRRQRTGENKVSVTAAVTTESFKDGFMGQKGRMSILDLTPTSCRFPIDMPDGEVRYCGQTIDAGTPYCEHHGHRCFNGTNYIPKTVLPAVRAA